MRKKNIILGVIGFALAVVTGGQALAALGPNDVSMGVFSIPLPADGKDACRVWLDKQTDSTLTCDDFFASLKGDPGSPGDNACYPVYSYTGWGTSSFQLNIKWCCGSGAVDCQEMTNSYPVENAYTNHYNAWLAQNCSVVFDTTSIENGYQVISKNPCTGEEETYNITGVHGQSANIVSVTPSYTPYPQSTNDGDNPEKQGYMTLTIGYTSGPNSVHTTPDPCEIYVKQYTSGENEGEYYNVKVCHDAQGSSLAGSEPVYAKGGSYEFAYEIPDGTLGLADVANKIPLTTENKYKGPDISNRKIGYKYVLETYPDGTTRETNKEFDQPEEVIEYVNDGVVTTNTGKRYTCGGKDTNTVCTNSGVKYCFELSASTGSVCNDAILVGAALDNEFNGTTGDYLYHGPNVSAGTKGYLYKVLTHGSGRVEEVDKKEDECDPVVGTTSAADSTLKTGQRCKCGGMTSSAPCNVANGTYLLGVYGGAQDLLSVMQNQVQVKIKMFGTTLYYCSGSATCCDANQTPGEGDFATCWTSVNIAGLHGDNGASCLATKSGTDWYICCSPSYTGDDCNKVIDDDIIAMLNGMMCQVNYTHRYLHDDGEGGFTANTTKDGARGERVIVTNSCNGSTENLDTYYGEDGQNGNDYNPCNGLSSAEALSTVSRRTTVYVRHGSTNNSTTTTGIGYYTETNVMCDTSSGNKIVKKYDKCDPVSLASGASRTVGTTICSGNQTLLMCTPQEGDLTPYPFCSDAEVSEYPKLVYVAPTVSDGKFTARGYTKWVHKYTSAGAEVDDAERHNPDECHTVYKRTFGMATDDGTGVRTATTTTQSTLKCTVQTPGTTGWSVGTEYCLNTTNDASTSCNGYAESTSDVITSTLRYHLPIMGTGSDNDKPKEPGYTYDAEVPSGQNETLRITNRKLDKCETLLTRTNSGTNTVSSSVTRCTVGAPTGTPGLASPYTAEAKYCLGYANGTCPGSLIDIGSAIDDAAENDPCAEISGADNLARAVKKVVSRTYTHTTGSQGALTSVYKMCNDDDHAETTPDECHEIIPTPAGQTCTNGVWMQCKRQADEGTADTTARGTTYGYCATYPQCVGNENSTTIVKKTERAYTAPTKTGTNSYYDTPGKMVTNKIPCSSSASAIVDSSEDDQCEEIPDTNSICPTSKKVLKVCKRKGDENGTDKKAETMYNLCTNGTSIFGTISDNDPCASVADNATLAAKTVKKTEYEYIAKGAGNNAGVGYVKKTKIMCDDTSSVPHEEDEYIYDTCVPQAQASGCNGASDKNYKCYKQNEAYNSASREYNTCNPSESAVALSSAVANKLDSDVTFTTGTYHDKDYILMSAGGVTNKPVVPVDTLKPQSLFEIWKDQYKDIDGGECELLFGNGKKCGASENNLTTSDMLNSFTAYGVWKEEIVKNASDSSQISSNDLSMAAYQNSLKPCQSFDITEDASYDGSQGAGKRYTMTCVE